MGCPYNAKFLFGIRISEEQATKLDEKMDSDELLTEDDYIEVKCSEAGNEEYKYYLDLSNSHNTVSNCEVIRKVSNLEGMKEKAIKNFNKSSLLKEYFSESDIEALLICEYVG